MTSNPNDNDSLLMTVTEALNVCEGNGMKTLLETVLNAAMRAERDKALNATPYERSEERQGYAKVSNLRPSISYGEPGSADSLRRVG